MTENRLKRDNTHKWISLSKYMYTLWSITVYALSSLVSTSLLFIKASIGWSVTICNLNVSHSNTVQVHVHIYHAYTSALMAIIISFPIPTIIPFTIVLNFNVMLLIMIYMFAFSVPVLCTSVLPHHHYLLLNIISYMWFIHYNH